MTTSPSPPAAALDAWMTCAEYCDLVELLDRLPDDLTSAQPTTLAVLEARFGLAVDDLWPQRQGRVRIAVGAVVRARRRRAEAPHQPLEEVLGMTTGELVDQVAASVATGWRRDPDEAVGEQRAGFTVDELPEVLIERRGLAELDEIPELDHDGEPTGLTTAVPTGVLLDRSTWDLRGLVSTLVVEVASLRARLRELELEHDDQPTS